MIYTIGLNTTFTQFKEISPAEAYSKISKHKLLCEDVETKGLDPHVDNPLLLIQIGTPEDQFIFTPDTITSVKAILEDRSYTKIVVNGIFERQMLRSKGIQLNSMFDLSLAFKIYRQGLDMRRVETKYGMFNIYSLAGMYKELLDLDLDKGQQSSFIGQTSAFTAEQIVYAAKDAMMFDLYGVMLNRLTTKELIHENYRFDTVTNLVNSNIFSKAIMEFKVQEYLADMLYNGIHVNKDKWLVNFQRNKDKSRELELELNKYIIGEIDEFKLHRVNPFADIKEKQANLFGFDTAKEKKRVDKHRINWKSNLQVKHIFNKLGIKLPKVKGKETINIKELEKIMFSNTMLPNYIDFKKLVKLVDSFGIKMFNNINKATGRVHFSVDQLLATGRIAPKKPNMAQIPSGKEWRDCFTPQDEEWDMVGADYSAQESRVMAYKSRDSAFMDFFENGDGDSHSMVASRVYSKKEGRIVKVSKKSLYIQEPDIHKAMEWLKANYPEHETIKPHLEGYIAKGSRACPLRQKGKVLNFFISFGGSAFTLSQSQGISMEEANELLSAFWEGFPELKEYFDSEKKLGLDLGYNTINSITGGKRFYSKYKRLREIKNKIEKVIKEVGYKSYMSKAKKWGTPENGERSEAMLIRGEMERASMNTGIQGTAADMTKTSAILLMEALEDRGMDLVGKVKPVNMVHDEHLLEVHPTYSKEMSILLKNKMEEASVIFINTIIPAEPYVAKQWEH